MNKKIAEYYDTPFFYGKRLKALIVVGYDKEKRTTEFYRVECYHKRHEILKEKTFNTKGLNDTDTLKQYQKAYEYAKNYLNNECKY